MARKTLLNEGEIRKFMKLANLGPLSEGFLDEQEDELEVEDEVALDEPGDDLEVDAELDMGAMDEPAPEEEVEVAGELDPEVAAQVEDALLTFLQGGDAALGEEFPELAGLMSVEADEEPVEDEVVAMDAEVEMEPALDGPPEEELEVAAVEDEEEVPGMRDVYQEQKLVKEIKAMQAKLRAVRRKKRTKRSPKGALVNEVTKRVTQRLLAESKREKRSDEIAENVIKRIQALKRS
tara:strand:+ start:1780 stop:2487 length:708 start_codon:yes stop_codon:yes gene_type:complete